MEGECVSELDAQAIERLTILAGLGAPRGVVPLPGGANNRVYRVAALRGAALLKVYFRHPGDPRDRLGAEFGFARFARAAGVPCVPRPLANDPAAGLGLYEFIGGQRAEAATDSLIQQAAAFVRDLNAARWRPSASLLPNASEACFSIEEHLGLIEQRVNRLGEITPASELDREAVCFVHRTLMPIWEGVRDGARRAARTAGISTARTLDQTARCISPSDFGFHNALISPEGTAAFIDFEYAGWDDPAKLVCDFFCQPAVPVPISHLDRFARSVADGLPDPASVLARSLVLLPVYRVKWICIRLNEFLPVGSGRRLFAAAEDREHRKHRQLASARSAVDAIYQSHKVSA